jgi:dipeptidyl aminopeptidase/acylaminoacyl peptidase
VFLALALLVAAPTVAQHAPTMAQFMSAAYPYELVSAKKADRIAWIAHERGQRNVYTAAAPDFRPVRLTRFLEDDGIDIKELAISDDGAIVVFVRGYTLGREDRAANPTGDPDGAALEIWATRTAPGAAAWRLAVGNNPILSPDGRSVLFVKEGQIYRVRATQLPAATPIDKAEKPFIVALGTSSNPRCSPDGTKIAFVSDRVDHAFIGVYDVAKRRVTFLSPSVDRDSSPTWSPDSKRIAFIRRPGLPFGMQAQAGTGGIGNPPGPAYVASAQPGGGRGGGGGFGQRQGGAAAQPGQPAPQAAGAQGVRNLTAAQLPGLMRASFKGGYASSFWVADLATGEAHEFWHPAPDDRVFGSVNAIVWAGDRVMFWADPDEWSRYYTVAVADGPTTTTPTMLNREDGLIESVAFTSLSSDGRTFFYCTNALDIERRHIWKVPTAGGEAVQLTKGLDIETYPVPLASGRQVALLSAGTARPQSVGLVPAVGGASKIIFPTLPREFPLADHVVPENVIVKAADGLEIHNQLFLPRNRAAGEKRPAIIFVHGGPVRQMLLGYHYMEFYHWAYGINQWLASQGYVVMSVNYRSGIGYGRSFRTAANTGARGNAEYQDVVAAANYLQGRDDVDPARVGIWGLSYGGLLTSQALARNSDIFVAGVDLAGVHLYTNSLDPENIAYQSSSISQIDKWKSPVLLVQGDDDRNVAFTQTVGLVQLLRAHDVYHELIVFPGDVHESLLYTRWMYTFDRMETFLNKFLKGATPK